MDSVLISKEQKNTFEKKLRDKGCVDLLRNCIDKKNKEPSKVIENVLIILLNYYVCLENDYGEEELSLEEKIRHLYLEDIIDEETKDNLLYLCEIVSNIYEMEEMDDYSNL